VLFDFRPKQRVKYRNKVGQTFAGSGATYNYEGLPSAGGCNILALVLVEPDRVAVRHPEDFSGGRCQETVRREFIHYLYFPIRRV
jgi:hypothetical protein